MALTKTITYKGFIVLDAYGLVKKIRAFKNKSIDFSCVVTIYYYTDSDKVQFLYREDRHVTIPYNLGIISYENIYKGLKLLDAFKDWSDC